MLAPFPDHNPRWWMGLGKKNASHLAREKFPDYPDGGLWAKRGHPEPIADQRHFENVLGYIADHAKRGVAIWRAEMNA